MEKRRKIEVKSKLNEIKQFELSEEEKQKEQLKEFNLPSIINLNYKIKSYLYELKEFSFLIYLLLQKQRKEEEEEEKKEEKERKKGKENKIKEIKENKKSLSLYEKEKIQLKLIQLKKKIKNILEIIYNNNEEEEEQEQEGRERGGRNDNLYSLYYILMIIKEMKLSYDIIKECDQIIRIIIRKCNNNHLLNNTHNNPEEFYDLIHKVKDLIYLYPEDFLVKSKQLLDKINEEPDRILTQKTNETPVDFPDVSVTPKISNSKSQRFSWKSNSFMDLFPIIQSSKSSSILRLFSRNSIASDES